METLHSPHGASVRVTQWLITTVARRFMKQAYRFANWNPLPGQEIGRALRQVKECASLRSDSGQSAVEYALAIALILFACIASGRTMADQVARAFNGVSTDLHTSIQAEEHGH